MGKMNGAPRNLPPSEYKGQWLCPCCGDDGEGNDYVICDGRPASDGKKYTHAETCATYNYNDACCPRCESEMLATP